MIKIIPVQKDDKNGKLIMKWRNDNKTREMSFDSKMKEWKYFKNEFYNNYFKNIPLFAIYNGQKIAFVSFIKCDDPTTLIIGINLSPNIRGKKLSTPIIKQAIKYIIIHYPKINKIVAEIKNINIASIKTFQRSGFNFEISYNRQINGIGIIVNKYIYEIKSQDKADP